MRRRGASQHAKEGRQTGGQPQQGAAWQAEANAGKADRARRNLEQAHFLLHLTKPAMLRDLQEARRYCAVHKGEGAVKRHK